MQHTKSTVSFVSFENVKGSQTTQAARFCAPWVSSAGLVWLGFCFLHEWPTESRVLMMQCLFY